MKPISTLPRDGRWFNYKFENNSRQLPKPYIRTARGKWQAGGRPGIRFDDGSFYRQEDLSDRFQSWSPIEPGDIIYIKGDLTQATESLIVHGCNAQGVMGSGVAKAVRAKWPQAYQTYKAFCDVNVPKNLLGVIIPVPVSGRKVVINAITQENYGKTGEQFVDYEAVQSCMEAISRGYRGAVAMPKIGSGLGGGDWSKIEQIIQNTLAQTNQVVVYEL